MIRVKKEEELTDLVNIGPGIARKLERAGIHTPAQFRRAGAKKAFERIRKKDKDACVCCYYALQGALCGKRWYELEK